jgi:hypothetical protein
MYTINPLHADYVNWYLVSCVERELEPMPLEDFVIKSRQHSKIATAITWWCKHIDNSTVPRCWLVAALRLEDDLHA